MKRLTPEFLVTVLPAEKNEAERMACLFDSLAPLAFVAEKYLQMAVTNGAIIAEQVTYDSQPAFLLWWHKGVDCLWINACQSYDSGAPLDAAFIAVDLIRQREQMQFVRFMTLRGGMVKAALAHGYIAEGVVCLKAE